VDIVDIFRRGDAVGPIVDEAIEKGVKVVWMQEGVINHEAAQKAKDAGLEVVMDRCIYKTYNKLFLGG
jgi:predicted CoA-binding protein